MRSVNRTLARENYIEQRVEASRERYFRTPSKERRRRPSQEEAQLRESAPIHGYRTRQNIGIPLSFNPVK